MTLISSRTSASTATAVIQFANAVLNCTSVKGPRISRRPVDNGKSDVDEECISPGGSLLRGGIFQGAATRPPPLSPSAESHLSLRKSSVPTSGSLVPSILRRIKRGRKLASVRRTSFRDATRLFVIAPRCVPGPNKLYRLGCNLVQFRSPTFVIACFFPAFLPLNSAEFHRQGTRNSHG